MLQRLPKPDLHRIGDGAEARGVRRSAGRRIRFSGRLPDAVVAEILQGARALVVTAVEEFGIAAVESQAAGRPVIARFDGGALETIVEGVSGCLWSGGPDDLARAVLEFDDAAVDPRACVSNALRVDTASLRDGRRAQVQAASAAQVRPGAGERQPLATTRLVRRAVRDLNH